ncbi:hypothetical protein GCM10020256_40530 [Streptomyces thermocoprophilus]
MQLHPLGPVPQTPTRPRTAAREQPPRAHKKIALDPAESSAIDDAPCVAVWAWGLLGQSPRRLELWFRAVTAGWGDLPGTRVFSCQASLRCCGMPASRARTSASR